MFKIERIVNCESGIKAILLGGAIMLAACSNDVTDPEVSLSAPQVITFETGTTSSLVTGELSGFDAEDNYTITVIEGQTLSVKEVDGGEHRVTVFIADPNGVPASDADASCNGNKTVSPTLAGTYSINVTECKKADPWSGAYKLDVQIEDK